jgi:hypothetical protein
VRYPKGEVRYQKGEVRYQKGEVSYQKGDIVYQRGLFDEVKLSRRVNSVQFYEVPAQRPYHNPICWIIKYNKD